tara:strand:- start:1050 stop:1205 length:156 start_codon:yes stop_codon:yes gene_type:complete
MNSKDKQNKPPRNEFVNPLSGAFFCKVSKASENIMLERFFNDKEIDFPFSN